METLRTYLRQAAAGEGRMVLLGGEAGIGKTTLVERFLREVRTATPAPRASVFSCDCVTMPGPLGPLFEIAQALGPEVERLLAEEAPRDRLFRAVFAALARGTLAPGSGSGSGQGPGGGGAHVLVGEDAHWSDEASLDLVRFLGRRIGNLPLLFVVTYRDDELGPYHPLRRVIGDLATAPAVRRMTLAPLSPGSVAELARGSGVDPAALHARTGGNPFFVTEVLAAGVPEVPDTVRDAVLARASRLTPEARAVLDAASVIGESVDPALLEAVIGGPIADAIEECLAIGTLRPAERTVAFRHGITRMAIRETISPPRYLALHRRVLAVLQHDPAFGHDLARLAHHAEEAGDRAVVLAVAPAAARQAAVFGAHREAAAQYARALRFAADLPMERRAELLEARSRECYYTGAIDEAIGAGQDALALREAIGDRRKEGDAMRWHSRLMWFAGRNREAERLAIAASTLLEPLPPGPELAMAYSNRSQLAMLADDLPSAIVWGERAIALATELGEQAILVNALNNVGTARFHNDDHGGRALIERSLSLAREAGLEDDVSRALANLASSSVIRCDVPAAEGYLDAGLRHTAERDLLAMERYFRATRAMLRFAQGDWDGAVADAGATAWDPDANPPSRTMALIALGRVHACRGDDPWPLLDEALALADGMAELQRLGPVRVARAEAAWLGGDPARAVAEARLGLALPGIPSNRWWAGELALWLRRGGGRPVSPVEVAPPYALELGGDWSAAATLWDELGFPLMAARARSEAGDEAAVRLALAAFDRLGARPDAARAIRRLRALGATRIPRGPRPATRINPGLLTQRELQVLRLVAAGLSNREIAARLYLSPKTAGHHVSAILAKLDVATRAEAADHALRLGLIPTQDRDPITPI